MRQSLRASVESYSIKKMEAFYGFVREIDLRDAGSSIVAFEEWLELGEGERPAADHLERIERYNRDDVVSNLRLRDWLETLRVELASDSGQTVPRPGERERVAGGGHRGPGAGPGPRRSPGRSRRSSRPIRRIAAPSSTAGWLLAQLLGWHRREDKAMWWEFHRLMDLTPEQLVDENAPIGVLVPIGPHRRAKKGKQTWRYAFPDQDYDLGRGDLYDPAKAQVAPGASPFTWDAGEMTAIDQVALTIDIRRDPEDAASACRRPARLGPDRRPPGVACSSSASGSPRTGSTPTARIEWRATC